MLDIIVTQPIMKRNKGGSMACKKRGVKKAAKKKTAKKKKR